MVMCAGAEHGLGQPVAGGVAAVRAVLHGGRLLLRRAGLHDQEGGGGLRLHHGHLRQLPRVRQVRPQQAGDIRNVWQLCKDSIAGLIFIGP